MPASGLPRGPRDTRRLVLQSQTGVRASAATRPLPQSKSRSRSSGRRASAGQASDASARASTNAPSHEWDSVRASLRGMSTQAMSTAEVGLRLFAIINRDPNLFSSS